MGDVWEEYGILWEEYGILREEYGISRLSTLKNRYIRSWVPRNPIVSSIRYPNSTLQQVKPF